MAINYPNGKSFMTSNKKQRSNSVVFGRRGMTLENQISSSNDYYLSHDVAVIYKKPTPVQIVDVSYPSRNKALITKAFFRQPSTTDYNGVYRGYYIDFDAKETKSKQALPFRNIHKHQIEHMRSCIKTGGICFLIIKFVSLDETYLLDANYIISRWDNQNKSGSRKSLSRDEVSKNGINIPYSLKPILPYLDAVDELIKSRS